MNLKLRCLINCLFTKEYNNLELQSLDQAQCYWVWFMLIAINNPILGLVAFARFILKPNVKVKVDHNLRTKNRVNIFILDFHLFWVLSLFLSKPAEKAHFIKITSFLGFWNVSVWESDCFESLARLGFYQHASEWITAVTRP